MLYKFPIPPDQAGYAIGETSNFRDSQINNGAPFRSKGKKGTWQPVSVTFTYAADEYRAFQSFYVGKLKNGVLPFLINLYLGSHEFKEYTARFQPNSFNMRNQGEVFTVTHNLLVKPRLDDNDGGAFALEYEAARRRSGITFGLYPVLVDGDTFSVNGSFQTGKLNPMPGPDQDNFSGNASLAGGSLFITVRYFSHDIHDLDTFNSGASLVGGSLLTTVRYFSHDAYDSDTFNAGASLNGGSLRITAAYAAHAIYDLDTFNSNAALSGGSLRVV